MGNYPARPAYETDTKNGSLREDMQYQVTTYRKLTV